MLARRFLVSPFPLITSPQPLYFHAITHPFTQRHATIPSVINSLRTLSIATGVYYPLALLALSLEGSIRGRRATSPAPNLEPSSRSRARKSFRTNHRKVIGVGRLR